MNKAEYERITEGYPNAIGAAKLITDDVVGVVTTQGRGWSNSQRIFYSGECSAYSKALLTEGMAVHSIIEGNGWVILVNAEDPSSAVRWAVVGKHVEVKDAIAIIEATMSAYHGK